MVVENARGLTDEQTKARDGEYARLDARRVGSWLFTPALDPEEQRNWDAARGKTAKKLNPKRILLHPECNFNIIWDCVSMGLILYSCLTIPYRLSFQVEATGSYLVFDRLVDIIFLTDVVLTFNKAVYVDGIIIGSYSDIRCRYLKGWFVPDFMSSFPFDLLIDASGTEADPNQVRLLKVIRIMRMVKIVRMVRIQRLLRKLQEGMGVKNGVMVSIKFMLFTMFAAHFQACLWFGMSDTEPDSNWAKDYCIRADRLHFNVECGDTCGRLSCQESCATDLSGALTTNDCIDDCMQCDSMEQYAASFYWSIVTLTTLGYGDVTPTNHTERMFCVYAMLLGASIFAYSVTNMCTLVHNLDAAAVFFRNQLDGLNDYLAFLGVEKPLQKQCQEFMLYKQNFSDVCIYNEDLILMDLSQTMQEEVKFTHLSDILKCVKIFEDEETHLLKILAVKVKNMTLSSGELVLKEGDIITMLYMVGKGIVNLSTEDGRCQAISHHGWFGVGALFRPSKFDYTANAKEYVDLYTLSKFDFEEALETTNVSQDRLERKAIELELIGAKTVATAGASSMSPRAKANSMSAVVGAADKMGVPQLRKLIKMQAEYIHNLENATYVSLPDSEQPLELEPDDEEVVVEPPDETELGKE